MEQSGSYPLIRIKIAFDYKIFRIFSNVSFRYIAAVTNTSGQSEIERAKNVLLHSNDILEAFGNAKVSFQS